VRRKAGPLIRSDERPAPRLAQRTSRSFTKRYGAAVERAPSRSASPIWLARTTDTIADTELCPWAAACCARRVPLLHSRRQIAAVGFAELIPTQSASAERELLEQRGPILALLESSTSPTDRKLIGELLEVIISGQELDLRRFAGGTSERIVALQSESELDDYTYRVGPVAWVSSGRRFGRAHAFPRAQLDETRLLADGVRFGKGLQTGEHPARPARRLAQGACYLPQPALAAAGLRLKIARRHAEKKCVRSNNRQLDLAEEHLAAGWPTRIRCRGAACGLRLACAWPVLIGVRTLDHLRVENPLDPARRIQNHAGRSRRLIWCSTVLYPFPSLWRGQAPLP